MTPTVLNPELVATRNHPWGATFTFQGEGVDEATFRAQVRAYPGAPGFALIAFNATAAEHVTGIRTVSAKSAGPLSEITVEVFAARAQIDALPRIGPRGDDQCLAWELDVALGDDRWEPWLTSPFRLREGVVRV